MQRDLKSRFKRSKDASQADLAETPSLFSQIDSDAEVDISELVLNASLMLDSAGAC